MYKRTVIKLSGEALAGKAKTGFDDVIITDIVTQIMQITANGMEVALIVGGGNFWRGRQAQPAMDRVRADQIGMLATVMNAMYVADAIQRAGGRAQVVTPAPFANITTTFEIESARKALADGVVLINAAGTGHPFFSTDTITALRAAELNADCILYAKNIDGVYDSDPRKNPNARKFRNLSYQHAIANKLSAADIAALHLGAEAGIASYVFALDTPNSLIKASSYPNTGDLNGTYVAAQIKEDYYV